MNTASEPYRTALLITTSMSSRRYLITATPMLSGIARNPARAMKPTRMPARMVDAIRKLTKATKATADPAINHFSCWRRSPAERRGCQRHQPAGHPQHQEHAGQHVPPRRGLRGCAVQQQQVPAGIHLGVVAADGAHRDDDGTAYPQQGYRGEGPHHPPHAR